MNAISPKAVVDYADQMHIVRTLVVDVDMKAGRKLSAANRAKLRAAQEVIAELLSLDEQVSEQPEAKANTEEPDRVNVDEPGSIGWYRKALDEAV